MITKSYLVTDLFFGGGGVCFLGQKFKYSEQITVFPKKSTKNFLHFLKLSIFVKKVFDKINIFLPNAWSKLEGTLWGKSIPSVSHGFITIAIGEGVHPSKNKISRLF